MSDESHTPENEDLEPDAESRAATAAAVEYGERFEACQVTVRKVQAAKRLIELAGGYKEAIVMLDAVWFANSEKPDEATAGARNSETDEDDSESEYVVDYKAWEARTRKVMAAETLLKLASGYREVLVLLNAVVVVLHGKQGHEQVVKVSGAAAGYHDRTAAAQERRDKNE